MKQPHARRYRPWYHQPVFIATVVAEAAVLLFIIVVAILLMSLGDPGPGR